jgi:ribosomal-protein-alanine N-acetyltransferase
MLQDVSFRPPQLVGERVLLRAWEPTDTDAVFAYASDPEVAQYMAWEPHASLAQSHAFLNEITAANYRHHELTYALCLKSAPESALGGIGVYVRSRQHGTFELGYVLRRSVWGQGLAPEAARLLIDYTFAYTNAERIYAPIFAENEKSRRAAVKMGLTLDGVLRSSLCFHGRRWDEAVYSILRTEWTPKIVEGTAPL